MPSSLIHMCVAKEVVKKISVNEEEFLYGSILPDYMIRKNYREKDKLHFYEKVTIGDITKENVNLDKFLLKYKNNINDSVSLGVYNHFITDNLWIENYIKNHLINIEGKLYMKTKRGNIRNNRTTLYKEYDRMAKWIVKRYNLSLDFIKNVTYTGKFRKIYNLSQDEIYNKIKGFMEVDRNEEMEIFTKDEIERFIKLTAKEVEKRLKLIM